MTKRRISRTAHLSLLTALLLSVLLACPAYAAGPVAEGPAASVNPLIGTGGEPDDGINLYPGAVAPFGMVQLSPDTENKGFGYHYIQKAIKGFSMTHMSGPGCANQGDIFFTPTTGPVVSEFADYQSPYSHAQEVARPGYYEVQLLQWAINAELTATVHTGVARFTFPAGKDANILVPLSHTLNHTAAASVRVVGDHRIEGYVENHAFCNMKPTYKVYFVMSFDRPFASFGTWTGDEYGGPGKHVEGSRSAEQAGDQQWVGAWATWNSAPQKQTITAKIGISFVDVAGAEKNLQAEAEGRDFDTIRNEAEETWNKELSVIDVTGGTPAERTVFYTALYHSLLMPSTFNDVDGRYMGIDHQVHSAAAGHTIYTNFSGWDVYRSEMPLLAMIAPRRMQDMAQSIVLMYQQGGWMPRWPNENLYTNDMIGSPLSIVIATAYLDGLHDFDINTAWEGMFKDATEAPPPDKPYEGEDGVAWIGKLHYLPNDKVTYGSVAKTLEYTLAYASLHRLALALGRTDDANLLYERALSYRNVFNPQEKMFWPRNADGSWVSNFNPAGHGHVFVEGTGWHYQSFAPADMAWLIAATGRERFNQRMTEFFNYPETGWYAQYYNPYNETDLQAPFAFNFSGEPWMTQRVVRRVLRENYTTAPDGVPGNDDGGAMSSWAVMSMMGIYTVDPASLAYELVSPTFSRIDIHLQAPYAGKSFSITTSARPSATPYIQEVTLNGKKHTRNWISFRDITAGGALHFSLGPEPNRAWGSAPDAAPPSLSDAAPRN